MKFSQRIGQKPVIEVLQIGDINTDLKNSLWNVLKILLIDPLEKYNSYQENEFDYFCKMLWFHFYKLPIDIIPENQNRAVSYIKNIFFTCEWFEIYDFLEFVGNLDLQTASFNCSMFKEFCNDILERENAGYRFIDNKIVAITNPTEINEIKKAIDSSSHLTGLSGVNNHLKNSLEKISDKKSPDYRNSIKESISAVESLARKISDNKSDTLGGALSKIKGKVNIHPALEQGFKNIYGYTNDASGIRHALTEATNCDFEDAKFMLVSCSAFINYLIIKADKSGIKLD